MTLPELERLVRRIEDALDHPTVGGGLQKLAADYYAAARAAATRLGQCAAMIVMGDEHQAIQLAETQPALLDLLTLLSFRRSPNWRSLCRGENLPAPEPFDLKALRQLNDTYAKGIDQDHALYRDYRRAVMLNDDARAVTILRSIVRLNPNDKNARGELDRLEHKFLHDKARKLETLVKKGGDDEEVARLVEELESAKALPQSEIANRARESRAHVLLKRVRETRTSGELRETQGLIEKLGELRTFFDENERAEMEEIERWVSAESQRRDEEAGRKAALERLGAVTQRLEEDLVARNRALREWHAALETLERAWRQVEQFRVSVPADLLMRVQRLRERIRNGIARSARGKRQATYSAVAAIVLICATGAWIAYSRHASRSLAAQLETMVVERRVRDAGAAIATSSNLVSSASLLEAREKASQFLQRELSLKQNFDVALSQLDRAAQGRFADTPPQRVVQSLEAAHKSAETLAPEFQTQANSALAKVEADWNSHRAAARAKITSQLDAMVAPLEATASNELQYASPPREVFASAQKLNQSLAGARQLAEAPVIQPNQESLFRLQNLQARVDKFSHEAANFLAARDQLSAATNFVEFNNVLQLLVSSGFTPAPERAAASVIAGLNLSSESLLAALLLPGAPPALLHSGPHGAYPETALPGEKEVQRRLRDDQNIHGISRLEIEVKALPTDDPHRRRVVYLRGELQRHITRRAGQIYDPIESPNNLNFTQREMGSLEFSVDEPAATPERELYDRASLGRLLDANTGQYQTSLLQVLDEINQDHRANPLFRAYLFMRVCEMIDVQPEQWGASWSPAFARDRAELSRLGAGQIRTGDWMVPAKISQRAAALSAHFDRAALHFYTREASFFRRLLPKAMQAGLHLVGYVSGDGQLILREPAPGGAIWGLTAPNAPAEIVRHPKSQKEPLPFSPLFVFKGDANALVDETAAALGYAPSAVGVPESLPGILRTATP